MVFPVCAVLITAGSHVPVICGLLSDFEGNTGGVVFWHSGPMGLKTGLISLAISMSMVNGLAHCPAVGVKVYEKMPLAAVLMVDGDHVPVMGGLFSEDSGRSGAVVFWHSGPIGSNCGLILGFTVTVICVCRAHSPGAGVNV